MKTYFLFIFLIYFSATNFILAQNNNKQYTKIIKINIGNKLNKVLNTNFTIELEIKKPNGQLQNAMVYLYEGSNCPTNPMPPAYATCQAINGSGTLVFSSSSNCFCIYVDPEDPEFFAYVNNYCPSPGLNKLEVIVRKPDEK